MREFFKRIKYAILPFIIFVITLCITYFGNQLLYTYGLVKGSDWPLIPLDAHIPYISWFVYFYFLTFPLGIITFFYFAYVNKKSFYNMFVALMTSFIISGIIYLFAQSVFTKPNIEVNSFTDRLVVWTWGSTNPVNCFPSQHCFMAFAMIGACMIDHTHQKKMNLIYKIVVFVCSVMIVCATVFIKQHFFMDIIASFVIYFSILAICNVFHVGEKIVEKLEKKREKKNKINRREL